MKFNPRVSIDRSKNRKKHFQAPAHLRPKIMSAKLSKELRDKYKKRALPVKKDDEVSIIRGTFKGREGKVVRCYRKKWVLHIERVNRDKASGTTVPVGIAATNVQITKLKMDQDRKRKLDPKNAEPKARKPRVKGRVLFPGEDLIQRTPRARAQQKKANNLSQAKADAMDTSK
eukprot:TRINITY_DN64131_c0_g1_i1.p1 TRINITY_DN64131_c0_g1~~TRINITY_DN64131_c0_g1_i1.p1  ORF type:complete len:173 (-),score=10.59 TRINITY_DN64131_c0_g1_i1:137-655(-)